MAYSNPNRGHITYVGTNSFKPKEFRNILKKEFEDLVIYWWKKFLPQHFSTRAQYKYGYQKRKKKYQDRKERKKGHRLPLVWSGDLKRQVTMMVSTAGTTATRGKGSMNAPKYMYQYKPGQPDKAKEVTTTSTDEIETMAKRLGQRLEEIHKNDKSKETVAT